METGEKKKENWQSRKADGKEKELKEENKASERVRERERERESPVYEIFSRTVFTVHLVRGGAARQ